MIVDGKLTEDVWLTVAPVKDFFRTEPRQGVKYVYETAVRVVYDKRSIYFGVFCDDSVGRKGIRVQDFGRDFNYYQNDLFGI